MRPLEKIGARRPFKRKMLELIRDRGGFAPILERIAAGETLKSIAKDYGCSPSFMHYLCTFPHGSKRNELYREARRASATAHMEAALEIVDTVPLDRDAIARAKLQVEHRRVMAAAFDRELFGDTKNGPAVVFNAGELYMQALQSPVTSGPALPAKEADLLEDDPDGEDEDHTPA